MKYPLYALLFLFALFLQVAISDLIAIGSATPQFCVILLLFVGLREGRRAAVIYGLCAGLLQDAMGGGMLGAAALVNSIVGFLAGTLMGDRNLQHLYEAYGLFVLLFAVYFALLQIVLYGVDMYWQTLSGLIFPSFLYTLVFSLLIFLIVPESVWHSRKVLAGN
jgi:rod shape-determining protein MreD